MSLPIYKTDSQELTLLQTTWKSQLDPVLGNPPNNSIILKDISLINGTTVIDHLLGRQLQGWKIVRQNAKASIYDAQDTNSMKHLTLKLVSDTAVRVTLEVF